MKLIILLLIGLPLLASSQEWMPVIPGETQHYRVADSNHITHSLRIDSVKQVGNNTRYYLNRVIRWKDLGEIIALKDQGQLLGQTMTHTADDEWILRHESFLLDTLIILHPRAGLGQSWLAVPESNVMASVTNLEETQFLGATDSVKTITFDNGAIWKLSKFHGLIQANDFSDENAPVTLTGLEAAGLGDRLYQMSDMFDYHVGDVFEFSQNSIYETGGTNLWYKIKILEKPVNTPDSLIYVAEKRTVENVSGLFNHTKYFLDTITIPYLKKDWERISSYHHQAVPVIWDALTYTTLLQNSILFGNPNPVGIVEIDTCSVYRVPDDPSHWLYGIEGGITCNLGYHYYEVFRPGIGRTTYAYSLIDYFFNERMNGAVIQGDTVYGKINPDWAFTQTNTPYASNKLSVVPNPAAEQITVHLPDGQWEGSLNMYHASGQLVNQWRTTQTETISIPVNDLPPGIYLLEYRSEKGIRTGKVLKM
ncbi:MAG: T9SS type A sorting domain-containing protein [Saprospiraceae bacterium]|nr:T9SS type A sorting domain-containing protein [Saprospiraceae bacterium]